MFHFRKLNLGIPYNDMTKKGREILLELKKTAIYKEKKNDFANRFNKDVHLLRCN